MTKSKKTTPFLPEPVAKQLGKKRYLLRKQQEHEAEKERKEYQLKDNERKTL